MVLYSEVYGISVFFFQTEITDFDDEVCERHVPWLARHLSKDVEKVAMLLEVDSVEIEAIKQDETRPERRSIKILNSWRNAEIKLGKKRGTKLVYVWKMKPWDGVMSFVLF